MFRKLTFIFLLVLFFIGCKSKQEAVVQVAEVKVPIWVSSRPNNTFKYVGIGFAEKGKSNGYQIEAKKNALYDLTSEIKVNISSNSVLYTVQNNNNFIFKIIRVTSRTFNHIISNRIIFGYNQSVIFSYFHFLISGKRTF